MHTKMTRTCFLLIMSVLLSAALKAQDIPCSQQIVPVAVSDTDGNMVTGLTASNFRVQVHRHPATINSAGIDISPRSIALLLDASGSMLDPKIWGPALNIAKNLVEGLPKADSVAFVVFGTQVERKIDFTRDTSTILKQIEI